MSAAVSATRAVKHRAVFIRTLLEQAVPLIDPVQLIQRAQAGLEIDGLQQALIHLFHDYHLQARLSHLLLLLSSGQLSGVCMALLCADIAQRRVRADPGGRLCAAG